MELKNLTIKDIRGGLMKKEFSAWELTAAHLDKIEKENDEIFAFLHIARDLAISQAKAVDEKIKNGEQIGILEGIPMAVKDNIMVQDLLCTSGSKILQNYIAPYDATVIEKIKGQGAVILGKTNMDEFAMGSSTETSAFGPTRNPRDLRRVPGGSSGGSAAAVAADQCAAALGSDTGGSIRQPACFCGAVGLKPTYGAVSRYGCAAYASSLDQIGPLAKTVADAQTVFDAIRGRDGRDSTSVEMPAGEAAKEKYRLGVPKEYFVAGMDPRVESAIKEKISFLEKQGHKIEEVSLPHSEFALACYYIIATSEASANLARYDGMRYGAAKGGDTVTDAYFAARGQGFGAEVRRRIMLGTYVLSAGYYDAYYVRAQKVRSLIKRDFDRALAQVDAIIAPVSPTLPFAIGEKTDDPVQMYLADIFTISVNLAGVPSLAMPCGAADGLPVGLQIIGRHFDESTLFNVGKIIES
ncbi:MAG TPA: Asp-tRNA(Asn)/Glu-tRNA(Gln) amidotransferase subunit GatA [Candidatus Pacearchaeota archaeon]|nr:Asp-tRNA(Asn)/Glu-tRNA(Gln) amidotransferase subunit GatA [Candidatus Pacearchaeota archaeon]